MDEEGHENWLDLEVTATPFTWEKESFVIFAARDISAEKRKEALERIFFHDFANTVGSLYGFAQLLSEAELTDVPELKKEVDLNTAHVKECKGSEWTRKDKLAAAAVLSAIIFFIVTNFLI